MPIRVRTTTDEQFAIVFQEIAQPVMILDFEQRILFANRAILEALKTSEEEILGSSCYQLMHKRESPPEECPALSIIKTKLPLTREVYVEVLNKTYLVQCTPLLNENGEIDRIIHIAEDTTKRKHKENSLRASEEMFRLLFDSTPLANQVLDKDSKIILVNTEWLRLLGYAREEAIGRPFSDFISQDDKSYFETRCLELKSSDIVRDVELTLVRKDGRKAIVSADGFVARDGNNRIKQMFCIFQEITEDKLTYVKLEQRRKELGEFAHGMSHDMTNQFLKLLLYVKLFESGEEPDAMDRIRRLVKDMQDLLEHSVTLANAGLAIEKRRDVDLDRILRDIAESLIQDDICYDQDLLPQVEGDSIKLRQIFQNLIENAVIHGEPKHIEVRFQEKPDCLVIEISNDGKRIPKAIRDKVFMRGFSSKKERKGLGLALVKKLIEAHGWWIDLEISPNTLFRITIPMNAI